ncbi:hypothetical protein DERP_014795 [Dermatophagoides pteronyssinus]|uniref:Endonuclease/exonuclease/phosphatase domain-containing protein n=1 Tax=Dermatophagoides pteronyssinus TaxID=6956 RepID=A0ABQ8J2F4_DERPT|nr:hypothetical protein DERP_014795 [Dermatophagoides pteronyssinus]
MKFICCNKANIIDIDIEMNDLNDEHQINGNNTVINENNLSIGCSFKATSTYRKYPLDKRFLIKLLLYHEIIISGDFNSHHKAWNNRRNDRRGRLLNILSWTKIFDHE